jgi:hypothetical protein
MTNTVFEGPIHTIYRTALRHAAKDHGLFEKCPRSICRRTRDCHGLGLGMECRVHWNHDTWDSFNAMHSFATAHFGEDGKFCEPAIKSKINRPKAVIPSGISASLAACEQALRSMG